jgi:taurine dioxygenase
MAEIASLSPRALSSIRIEPVGVYLGGEVTGVDLTKPLEDATVETILTAHAEHGMLTFPDQNLSGDQLVAFGRQLGELTVHPFSTNAEDTPELIVYDNKEGNPPPRTDVWHTDEMFREAPPMGSILSCKIIPERGAGDTAFVNMGAVFESLSDRMQQHLSGLEAINDFRPFRILFPDTDDGHARLRRYQKLYPPRAHPVVRVHPVTGRKVIYVSPGFTRYIKGMDEGESMCLLEFLFARTRTHEYHYRHRWQPGTLVFWDNRLVQHSAIHDYYPHRRLMERVTLMGTTPVGDAPAPDPSEIKSVRMPSLIDFGETRAKRHNEN